MGGYRATIPGRNFCIRLRGAIDIHRWTYEDQCAQLADARAELARVRAADRYYAELLADRDLQLSELYGIALMTDQPGMLLGHARLVRGRQGSTVPLLLSEKPVDSGIMLAVLSVEPPSEDRILRLFDQSARRLIRSVGRAKWTFDTSGENLSRDQSAE